MPEIKIHSMEGHPEWIAPCAAWWHGQWGQHMGYSPDQARAAIADLTLPGGGQAALIALVEGNPTGSAFLVDCDLESHAHLTPWLAGLFVLPKFRRMGVGEALVASIAAHAGLAGREQLYLYTSIAEFYRQRGWTRHETILLHDVEHEIMTRPLQQPEQQLTPPPPPFTSPR
jgi:GNAT superfamily N-acetyltransferase